MKKNHQSNLAHKGVPTLDRRLRSFDSIRSEGAGDRAGSKWIKNGIGKMVMYHRPGSKKR